ncbi:hypothetical protein BGX23_007363 [Mortierella sp. AD031]|nr:hypothetical protein BGX23_007363 [Mortierella sp. AD031]
MKRSNDYAQHDAFKKPRVAQGYNNSHSHSGGGMGGSSSDMYGSGGYGANPMMMGGYGQMGGGSGGQYGSQYGGDLSQSLPSPYQQFTTPTFGAAYGNTPFQMSFPPNAGANNGGSRTVYIGNVPAEATIEDILNLVRNGIVENARLLPEKNCAFSLRADFSQFGVIDTVKVLREKSIAFVHFTNIGNAIKSIAALSQDPRYTRRRMNYGKDRCAKNKTPGTPSMPNAFSFGGPAYPQYGSPMSFNPNFDRFPQGGGRMGGMGGGSNYGHGNNNHNNNLHSNSNNNSISGNGNNMIGGNNNSSMFGGAYSAQGNRTVYLGNIGPDTTCEDLCNAIRGGILNNIRYFPAKHIAFVSFVDPQAATNFYNQANHQGITVKTRRLKAGWGQNMHSLPMAVIQALQNGATRNVYLGSIDEGFTEERLRHDFSEYGEIEMVNILQDKNCGFVNFTNILSAVKAVDGIRKNPAYEKVKINFGKDRCGNPPKMMNNNNGSGSGNGSHHSRGNHHSSNNGQGHSNGDGNNEQEQEGSHGAQPRIEDSPSDIKAFEEDEDMFQISA